jgi:hypothetical protein
MNELYSDYDGSPVVNASDLNHEALDRCDSCGKHAYGTMLHAAGATGRVCPVLFLCYVCNPVEEAAEEIDEFDDSMDGDWDSGMASAGWGTDEDYGYFGD